MGISGVLQQPGKVHGDLRCFDLPLPKCVASTFILKCTSLSKEASDVPAFPPLPNNRKEGLSYPKNLPQHFCLYLLGSDWVTWPPWLQVKLENVVFQLRTVTTFQHILSKLDGVHFCAQMERTERSSSMGEQCVVRSSMGSDSKMLNSKGPCEIIVTQIFK